MNEEIKMKGDKMLSSERIKMAVRDPLALDTNEIMEIFATSGHEEIETEMSTLEKNNKKVK